MDYADLQAGIESGDFNQASAAAARIVVGGASAEQDDLVDALCVQASLAALSGATNVALGEMTSRLRNAVGSSFEKALASYVEGVVALTAQKTTQLARLRFDQARESDDTFIFARLGLGACDFIEEKYDHCFNHFKNVLRQLGDDSPNIVRVVLAISAFRLKQFDHARLCVQRALAVDDADPLALLVLFGIQIHFREVKDAARTISKLMQNQPTIVVTQKYTDLLFFNALKSSRIAHHRKTILALIDKTESLANASNNKSLAAYAMMQRGRLLHAEGRLSDALAQYDSALAINAQLTAAVVHRVQLLHDLKGESVAREELRLALERHPSDPEVLLMTTVTKATLGQHAEAIRHATYLTQTVAKELPDAWSIGAWASRLDNARYCELATFAQNLLQQANLPTDRALDANAAVLAGKIDAFVRVATEAIGVDLSTAAAESLSVTDATYPYIFNYAYLLESTDAKKAHSIYRQLVKRGPHEAAAFVRLVYMSMSMNRPFEAARWAKLLSLTHPNDRSGIVLLAWVLKEQGHAREALEIVHEETKSKRDVQLALVTGALFMHDSQGSSAKTEKVTRAMNGFQFALRHDADNVLAAHGAACCVALQGYLGSAAQILERVAEADCNSDAVTKGIREHRFNLFVESHAFRSAIGLLGSLPVEKLTRWQCCALATCYARISQHDRAIQILNAALALHHNDASVCYYLVLCLLASVFEALEKEDTLSEQRGAECLDNIKRALSLVKYAQRVKSDHQRQTLEQIVAFVNSNNLDASVKKRMRDRTKEREHTESMRARWRQTHQSMIEDEILKQRAAEELAANARAEREQREALLYERTQDFIRRSYTGTHVEQTEPNPAEEEEAMAELNADELAAYMASIADGIQEEAPLDDGIRARDDTGADDELLQPSRSQPPAEGSDAIPATLFVGEQ